ncbi:MAG: hypothetical protein HUJ99_05990, partial [Bacteroidaceae bacterium]|nr:hypothetical protein [Bacteroidaceae bacterium]
MELIYQGVFYSECNVEWEVKILSTTGTGSVGELRFAGSEPLTFEWNTESKEVPLCGSSATLTIISPGDRTYEGLYTITPGSIRMDAYRNGVLYWSGTLDPEFYEEPYSAVEDYEVSLTFSDFGILDRLAYDMEGMKTLMDVLQDCINRSGINVSGIDQSLISTSLSAQGSPITLGDLTVRSDNFYDEDGEASTLKEVLEGVLQPLALRMVQRCGKIWIYDLNGLYTLAQSKLIKWMGSDQNMGVDVVYNNAKITWSTYAESGNLNNAECWVADTDPELTALDALGGDYWKESWYYSYHASTDHWLDLTDVGFTLWTNYSGKNAQLIDNDIKFFKIIPQGNGEACEGIALLWRTFRMNVVQQVAHMSVRTFGTISTENFGLLNSSPGTAIWKSGGVWIPPVGESDRLLIRISTGLLMDPRYNPYISAVDLPDGLSQKQWEELWNDRFNMIYIPVRITFTTDDGGVYVWTNRSVVEQDQPVTN